MAAKDAEGPSDQGAERTAKREAIGNLFHQARVRARDHRLRSLEGLAGRLGIAASTLSNYEHALRDFPAEILGEAANVLDVRVEAFFPGAASEEPPPAHPYGRAVEFLQRALKFGVEDIFPNRADGLSALASYARRMQSGRVMITSSSMRGLTQDPNNPFVRQLIEDAARRPRRFQVQVLMTDPRDGGSREALERRLKHSIVNEILDGIHWCLTTLDLDPTDIRLLRASPSCFCVFLQDDTGVGLFNPYEIMSQGFNSFTLLLRSGADETIYKRTLRTSFEDPWTTTAPEIANDLAVAIEACREVDFPSEVVAHVRAVDDLVKEKLRLAGAGRARR